ncbi:MAG: helix-turn-helix transcriptional regulator [Deltaproteobacteria bacterium]|nr:helix-turn-helix transcriptional regulator [Deltaproteobacteria bacterium]
MTRRGTSAKTRAAQADRCGVFSTDEKRVSLARAAVPSDALAASIAAAFKAIAHPTRVRILRALSEGELCVCEISEVLGLSVSATSHQLSLLKVQRLVQSRSDGKLVYYSLGDRFVLALLDDCTRHLSDEEAA